MKNITNWFLYVEKRLKNNDFRSFFAKNGKFDDRGKFEKSDFHNDNDFFKHHSYYKFNADSNAKKNSF